MKKALLFLLAAAFCFGQDEAKNNQGKFYRFDFAFKELDGGKAISQRNYSAIGNRFQSIMIRSGEKIPVSNIKSGENTYLDIGTNIDCRIQQEKPDELQLYITADASTANSLIPPVITQTKWSSDVVVPLKKPTILYSSDSASKKTQTQLEITVTPLQ